MFRRLSEGDEFQFIPDEHRDLVDSWVKNVVVRQSGTGLVLTTEQVAKIPERMRKIL